MNKRLGPHPSFKGFIAGCLVASLVACGLQPVTASVDDNLGSLGIKIADALGVGKENSIPEEADFQEASVTEKLNYLQNEIASVNNKIDKQTEELQESIDTGIVAATAPYNLYVYFPKTDALADYSGEVVSIISNTGNQVSTAKLKDDGVNYSTKIYFDFSGNCTLKYNLLNSASERIDAVLPITVDRTGLEQKLNVLPKDLTWQTIHNILQANSAEDFKLTVAGTELPGSCFVQGQTTDTEGNCALKLWKQESIGSGSYSGSCTLASNYKTKLNTEVGCNIAYSSRIVEHNEVSKNLGCNFWVAYYNNDYYYYSYEGYTIRSNTIISGTSTEMSVFPIVYIH